MNKTIPILLLLTLLLLPFSFAAYDRSTDYRWDYPFYDTAGTSYVQEGGAYLDTNDEYEQACTITSKTLTAQPLVLEISGSIYTLVMGNDFVEAYDDECAKTDDITLNENPVGPFTSYWNGTDFEILFPVANNTIERYVFDENFSFVGSYTATNLTGSGGVCHEISGVPYCYWQNITNDLQRLTLTTGTITGFDVMEGSNDTSRRYPVLRPATASNDIVFITGKYTTLNARLCAWDSVTETLKASFNSGACVSLATSVHTNLLSVTHPAVHDFDGGSADEVAVAGTYDTGGGPTYAIHGYVKVYEMNGVLGYEQDETYVTSSTTNRAFNIYNPIPVQLNATGSMAGQYHACTIGDLESSIAGTKEVTYVLCAGEQSQFSTDVTTDVTACDFTGTSATTCEWHSAVMDRGEGLIDGSGTARVRQGIGQNKYLSFDEGNGGVSVYNFSFNAVYSAIADTSGDSVLDVVYGDATTIYLLTALVSNSVPEWSTSPGWTLNAETTTLCLNETYTILTSSSTAYTDADDEDVRMFIDLDDGTNTTSSYGTPGSEILQATITYTAEGNYELGVYLQDVYLEESNTLDNTTYRYRIVSVTDDTDVCSAAGSGVLSDSITAASTQTPEESYNTIIAAFGLSAGWGLLLWLFIMALVTISVYAGGLHHPAVLGLINLFMLIAGKVFGAVPTFALVLIGILLAGVLAVWVFVSRGD